MYQPTGEQIEALADVQHDTFIGHGVRAPILVGGTAARRIAESPAFQAIIRAAQAEALINAAEWWAENPDHHAFETPGDTRNWLRDRADIIEAG